MWMWLLGVAWLMWMWLLGVAWVMWLLGVAWVVWMWLCWMWLLCFAFYCTSHTLACAIDALGHGSPLAIIRCHTPVASIIVTSFANLLRARAISMSSANVAILLVVVMVVTI